LHRVSAEHHSHHDRRYTAARTSRADAASTEADRLGRNSCLRDCATHVAGGAQGDAWFITELKSCVPTCPLGRRSFYMCFTRNILPGGTLKTVRS
jgi:hypothetical protein